MVGSSMETGESLKWFGLRRGATVAAGRAVGKWRRTAASDGRPAKVCRDELVVRSNSVRWAKRRRRK